ncbi:MAG: hypothetical protein AB7S41_04660 [Parvibaculaceae bacterium]
MQRFSDDQMRKAFFGWQCRIRQIAMREHGGRPLPAMQPRAMLRSGETVIEAMTIVLLPKRPAEATAFLRFQVQKTPDPARAYEAALGYLQAEHYRDPEAFAPEMTAVFPVGSGIAATLAGARRCLLEFEQWSQRFRFTAAVRELPAAAPTRTFTLAHNRIFNPNLPAAALVLGFKPDWKTAQADPLPTG